MLLCYSAVIGGRWEREGGSEGRGKKGRKRGKGERWRERERERENKMHLYKQMVTKITRLQNVCKLVPGNIR